MTTPKHTKVGPGLFAWPPFRDLRRADSTGNAAHLWQVLYMSNHAKLVMPGLWLGGCGTMADAAHMTPGETHAALVVLEERGMVEFDPANQVLRFTMLPDKCEAATSPNAILGWWGKYQTVPDCGVKQRYLELLCWLQLPFTSSKRSEKENCRKAWDETFGAALNALNISPVASAAPTPALSASAQRQLDLTLAATDSVHVPVHVPPPVPHRSGEGEVKGSGEGESERVIHNPALEPPPAPAPQAGAQLAVVVSPPADGYQPPDYLSAPDPDEPPAVDCGHAFPTDEPADVVEAHDLWNRARDRLRGRMLTRSFEMFIDPIEPVARDGPLLHLRAPTPMAADHFRLKHRLQVEAELTAITGTAMQIAI